MNSLASLFKPATRAESFYRFDVGTNVLCCTGENEWSAGVVVELNYREDHWPPGRTVPYQVSLLDGTLIFVPKDIEGLCRKLVPPWWAGKKVFKKSASLYAEYNPSAEDIAKECEDKDVNEQDHQGKTAVMEAVTKMWPNAILQLIDLKADVNIAANNKTCAIHIAAQAVASGTGPLKVLLDAKADLNVQDTDPDYDPEFTSTTFGNRLEHRTPLHYVCMEGDAAAATMLLQANAKIDIGDAQYKTPLHLAMEEDQMDCVDVLLKFGADMNLGNHSSGIESSALIDAAAKGKLELAKRLIAAKADVNKQGKQQMSALHLAARGRRIEIIEALLAAKADMNQESKLGTALQLARKNGGVELLKVFGMESDMSSSTVDNISSMDAAQRAALFLD